LRKLIADAATIEEIKKPVTATHNGFAVRGELISKTESRTEVVIVVGEKSARRAIAAGDDERAGSYIEIGLAIFHFGGPGHNVVADAQVESEAGSYAPVVLREETIFPASRAHHSKRRTDRIGCHETGEEIGNFVAGDHRVCAVAGQVKETFSGERAEEIEFTANNIGSEFHGVVALVPGNAVGKVGAGLRHQEWSEVAGEGNLRIEAADEGDAAQQRRVAVGDAEVGANRSAVKRRSETVRGSNEATRFAVKSAAPARLATVDPTRRRRKLVQC
jgi:hypothetical protein